MINVIEIEQGSNNPIELNFFVDISNAKAMEVSLYNEKRELKHWDISKVTISGSKAYLPLTQVETVAFDKGAAILSVKILDSDGATIFFAEQLAVILYKFDKTIMEE